MEIEELELTNVTNSEAFKIIDSLLEEGTVDEAKAKNAKQKYNAIHDALVKVMSNEQSLLERAKELKGQLDAGKQQGDGLTEESSLESQQEQLQQISLLKEDAEQARAEAALCDEREQLQQLEVIELQRQRNELQAEIDEINEEHRAALEPQVQALQQDVAGLRVEIEANTGKLVETQNESTRARQALEETAAEVAELQRERQVSATELNKWKTKPEKLKRQTDIIASNLGGLKQQHGQLTEKLNEAEIQLGNIAANKAEIEGEQARALAALDRARVQNETKERSIEEIRKDLELASIDAEQLLANQVSFDLKIKNVAADLKREMDMLARATKEKDTALRRFKKSEQMLKIAEDQLPPLRMTRERLSSEKAGVTHQHKTLKKSLIDIKREVDIYMSTYLKEESIGKEKAELFAASFDELNELEAEVAALKAEEQERERYISDLTGRRDNMCRVASSKTEKYRETRELAKTKQLIANDLRRKRKDTVRRVKDFQQLYDLVKNQRNKFVNLIQAANQSCAEMREKLKIIGNEVEILRGESLEKEKLLTKERADHTATTAQRDQIRSELNKCSMDFKKKQDAVDEQIVEMEKLNSLINSSEKEMLRLKKQYETVVESRNFTGIMLIDRNDELCILYEKANIQEEVQNQGDLAINRLDDEARMLELERKEAERSIEVTRRLMPQIPLLDEDVARLQKDLLEARRESERLSLQLEDPENAGRWRRLEGKIPTPEELQAKMNQLEERLNDKKEQLLEKELILEEVSGLSDRLRGQAAEGREDTLELAKKVNDYQGRLRGVTRRLMATISELSMYQATSMKLAAERDDLQSEADTAKERLERGEPPTEEAEREWFRKQRERFTLQVLQEAAQEAKKVAESSGAVVQTTAEPRPNAYIPENLGIPKPFGSYAPFKPQEPGSTMRHIRKPQPKEVVI